MRTVLTYGTFDLFHVGHVRLLQRLRDLGDRLVVGCSTDEFNRKKNKKALFPFESRAEILSSCKYVDLVIPENDWEQKVSDIKEHKVDIFAMGDDWAGKFDFLQKYTKVHYLPRTTGISTTNIKNAMHILEDDRLYELRNAVSHVQDLIGTICEDRLNATHDQHIKRAV